MTASTTAQGSVPGPVAPAEAVRTSVETGVGAEGVEIVRRAERGPDALLLLSHADGSWWIGRRVADVSKVVAYIGDLEAERDFELFLSSPSPRGQWVETEVSAEAA